MSDSKNNASEEVQAKSATLKRAIGQHLMALSKAGVATLPRGTGEFEIAFSKTNSGGVAAEPPAVTNQAIETPQSSSPLPSDSASHVAEKSPAASYVTAETPTESAPSTHSVDASGELLPADAYGASFDRQQRKASLEIIRTEVAGCTKCDELCSSRTQTVFGVGTETARLVFVGEGPGADEDRLGEPFVGAAGQLLDKIITACKLSRSDVYILNTVKCRPPGNRNPSPAELDNCWGYAERQLEILQPEFICCLGSVAAKRVLKTTQSLGRLRQRFHSYRGSRVIVTYHPAYLLRTESAKRHVWEDMKLLMKEMGVDL